MIRTVAVLIGLATIGLSGAMHGWVTDRWEPANDPTDSAAKLARLSLSLGDWQGQQLTIADPGQLGRVAGMFYARYVNARDGTGVEVFLVSGRPRLVAIHTPDVCYQGSGFDVAATTRFDAEVAGLPPAAFWTAQMIRSHSTGLDLKRIFWSFSADGTWQVPDSPRLAYAKAPVLYKLYLIRDLHNLEEAVDDDPCKDLMQRLLPELDRVLFARSTPFVAPNRPGMEDWHLLWNLEAEPETTGHAHGTNGSVRKEPSPIRSSLGAEGIHARWYGLVKPAADLAAAFVLFWLTLPFLLIGALLVKLTSRGPAIYSQLRLGQGGRPFRIYKLRTMADQCESATGPRWSLPGDARVTRVGRVLRRTHLDELPQLVNVLKRQMSLVGPRPERPEFLPALEAALPTYQQRLLVRPGVTGLAQVQLPADTDLSSVRQKLVYDLYYVRRRGAWLDLRILLATAGKVAGIPPELLRKLCWLPSFEAVERVAGVPIVEVGRAVSRTTKTPELAR